MAWVNIPDTATDPDAPLTSSLAKAWTGNPIAIANGDTGAPKVKGKAMSIVGGPITKASPVRNLEDAKTILVVAMGSTTSSSAAGDHRAGAGISYRLSSDNGLSWSSSVSMGSSSVVAKTGDTPGPGVVTHTGVSLVGMSGFNAIDLSTSSSDSVSGAVIVVEGV